jgi:hypothetical protein
LAEAQKIKVARPQQFLGTPTRGKTQSS